MTFLEVMESQNCHLMMVLVASCCQWLSVSNRAICRTSRDWAWHPFVHYYRYLIKKRVDMCTILTILVVMGSWNCYLMMVVLWEPPCRYARQPKEPNSRSNKHTFWNFASFTFLTVLAVMGSRNCHLMMVVVASCRHWLETLGDGSWWSGL